MSAKPIGEMLLSEVMAELDALTEDFGPADFERLESELHLKAAALCWPGDPLRQPPRAVLASARAVLASRQRPAVLQSALP